jgi:hypothetical protein
MYIRLEEEKKRSPGPRARDDLLVDLELCMAAVDVKLYP